MRIDFIYICDMMYFVLDAGSSALWEILMNTKMFILALVAMAVGIFAGWYFGTAFPLIGYWGALGLGLIATLLTLMLMTLFHSVGAGEAVTSLVVVGLMAAAVWAVITFVVWPGLCSIFGDAALRDALAGASLPMVFVGIAMLLAIPAFVVWSHKAFRKATLFALFGAAGGITTGYTSGMMAFENLPVWFAGGAVCGLIAHLAIKLLRMLVRMAGERFAN